LALYYLETSALVKLYVDEPGTRRLLQLAAGAASNQLAILSLSQIELRSAIRRRERTGEITHAGAQQILVSFQRHLEGRFLRQVVTDSILDSAGVLVDRHALRAYDSVQLAGYLVLRANSTSSPPTFVCSDRALLLAAQNEGGEVLDPCASQ
jgi:uncharacterized protein